MMTDASCSDIYSILYYTRSRLADPNSLDKIWILWSKNISKFFKIAQIYKLHLAQTQYVVLLNI